MQVHRLLADAGAVQALAVEAATREACGLREKVGAEHADCRGAVSSAGGLKLRPDIGNF